MEGQSKINKDPNLEGTGPVFLTVLNSIINNGRYEEFIDILKRIEQARIDNDEEAQGLTRAELLETFW